MAGYAFRLQASDLYSTSTAGDQMPTKEQVFDLNPDTCKIGFGGDAPGAQEEAAFRFHRPVEFSGGVLGLGEYALEETDTGRRFLDGRKIYARTFLSYLTASALTPMGKIDDLGETVYLEGVVRIDDGSVLPFNLYYSSSSYCYAQVLQNGVVSGYSRYAVAMRLTVYYTRASQEATRYALPALNANSEQGCQLSASSTYSTLYPVYRAFDGNLSTHWATQATDAQPWVQVMFPQALKNLVVRLTGHVPGRRGRTHAHLGRVSGICGWKCVGGTGDVFKPSGCSRKQRHTPRTSQRHGVQVFAREDGSQRKQRVDGLFRHPRVGRTSVTRRLRSNHPKEERLMAKRRKTQWQY